MTRIPLVVLCLPVLRLSAAEMPWRSPARAENLEEPGGLHMGLLGGDGVGGITVGSATWLRDTWILGDYEAGTFYHDDEGSLYGSLGMTIRLMPRWKFAPFVGAGGAYNQAFGAEETEVVDGREVIRGASYWAGVVEAGFRLEYGDGRFLDLSARHVWPSVDAEDSEYVGGRIAFGVK